MADWSGEDQMRYSRPPAESKTLGYGSAPFSCRVIFSGTSAHLIRILSDE